MIKYLSILLIFAMKINISYGQSKMQNFDSIIIYKIKTLESTFKLLKKENSSLIRSNSLLRKKLDSVNHDLSKINKEISISNDTVLKIKNTITSIDTKASNDFNSLSVKNSILTIILIITIILIFGLLKWLLSHIVKLNNKSFEEVDSKFRNELNKVDLNILKVLDIQVNELKQLKTTTNTNEINHTLPLKVGDEIHRMKKRIENMPIETKGLTALNNSLSRLVDEFNDAGYEFEDLLGRKYIDGMKLEARFIDNPDMPKGEEIITDVLKPQINYLGVVIQTAKVEVSKSY